MDALKSGLFLRDARTEGRLPERLQTRLGFGEFRLQFGGLGLEFGDVGFQHFEVFLPSDPFSLKKSHRTAADRKTALHHVAFGRKQHHLGVLARKFQQFGQGSV